MKFPGSGLGTVWLIAVIIQLIPTSAAALDADRLPSQYMHDRYGREDGLPSDVVWTVIQDRQGYLWMGTQNGLVRFDGVDARVYGAADHPGLANQDVRAVLEAGNGDLWVGTYGGGAARLRDGRFEPFGPQDGLSHSIVYDIYQAEDGAIWFGTGGGVTRLGPDGDVRTLTAADGLAHDRIFDVYQDDSGAMWFASLVGGVSRWRDGEFTTYDRGSGLVSDQVHEVYQDSAGRIWIGTYEAGFYRMTESGPRARPLPEGAGGNGILTMLEDRRGNLWLGTYNNGVIRVSEGEAVHFDSGPLVDAYVFDIFEDREGSLWFATRDGLHRLGNGKFLNFGAPEGLADATFVVAHDAGTGTLWSGTEGAGLFGLRDGRVERYTSDDGLASDSVSALAPDGEGGLWVGSFGGGLNHLGAEGVRTWTRADGLPSNHVFALAVGPEDRLWVAADGGIARMSEDGFEVWTREDGLPDALVRKMRFDRAGDLWLGTNGGGLARFDGRRFETFPPQEGGPGNIVYAIHQDVDGWLWFGTRDSGLSLLREGEFHHFTTEQGLPQASVFAIGADGSGAFWLSGASGLVRVQRAQLLAVADGEREHVDARLFDEADGLRNAQFVGGFQPTVTRDDSGRLWFPGPGGLVRVDPSRLQSNTVPPPVVIERVLADGRPVDGDGVLSLQAGSANLELEYTALSLVAPDRVRFRYRLAGYDRGWQSVGSRRTAYYTGLPPGQYEFEVHAANNDGVWSRRPASLRIVQEAHFWQTHWFRVLIVAAVVLLGFSVYRLSVRQFRVREQRLSRLVSERTEQLERALETVERSSRIDGLTELANRGYFDERLEREWKIARREGRPLGLILADIDHFKQLNDNQGHQVGDDCLRAVANALVEVVKRPSDLVARYGGEEFVVLLPDADADAVAGLAEEMRSRVESLHLPHPDGGIDDRVTISAGCASLRPDAHGDPRTLVERADRAMYEAKRGGRNRVIVSD